VDESGQRVYNFDNKANTSIRLDDSQWPTSTINALIAKIILEEHMGFQVSIVKSTGLDSWPEIARGNVHANLEIWPSEGETVARDQYIKEEGSVLDLGALGVVARNGFYVPTSFAEEYPQIQSYLGWMGDASVVDFLKYTKDNYTINPSLARGLFIGPPKAWAPTEAEVQIVTNLNISLEVHYSGDYLEYLDLMLDCLLRRKNHSGKCIMYNYFPSTIESGFSISRVGLPHYSQDCYDRADQKGIDCDYDYFILEKIGWAGLRDYSLYAYEFLQKFKVDGGTQTEWLKAYGTKENYEIACDWIRNNSGWRDWIPASFSEKPAKNRDWVYILVGTIAAIVVLALICRAVWWVITTYRSKKRLKQKLLEYMQNKVESCRLCLHKLEFPMILVRADRWCELKEFTPYEQLRDRFLLKALDDLQSIAEFRNDNTIIFFSHQWLAWGNPDPDGKQWAVMQRATQFVVDQNHPLEKIWVWADYSAIPQRSRSLQELAIMSLPTYAFNCDYFIVITPDAVHKDTGTPISLESYQDRMWCRAEQLSHVCSCGTEAMYFADDNGVQSGKDYFGTQAQFDAYLDIALKVFDGYASCCSLGHRIRRREIPCDREHLVVPMGALYAQLRARPAPRPEQIAIRAKFDKAIDDFFPKQYIKESQGYAGKRELFGDLMAHITSDVDANPNAWDGVEFESEASVRFSEVASHMISDGAKDCGASCTVQPIESL